MPSTTPRNVLPYPLPTEPVAEGAQAMRNLAEALDLMPKRLFDTTLAAPAATIDIPAIPATYAALRLVAFLRSDVAATSTLGRLRLNGQSYAGNCAYQKIQGAGAAASAVETLADTWCDIGNIAGATSPGGSFSLHSVLIPYYTAPSHKAIDVSAGVRLGATTGLMVRYSIAGWFLDGTAISRLTIHPSTGNLVAGSRVTLYGLA